MGPTPDASRSCNMRPLQVESMDNTYHGGRYSCTLHPSIYEIMVRIIFTYLLAAKQQSNLIELWFQPFYPYLVPDFYDSQLHSSPTCADWCFVLNDAHHDTNRVGTNWNDRQARARCRCSRREIGGPPPAAVRSFMTMDACVLPTSTTVRLDTVRSKPRYNLCYNS